MPSLAEYAFTGSYIDPAGVEHRMRLVGDIQVSLESGQVSQLGLSGNSMGHEITMVIWPPEGRATFKISEDDQASLDQLVETIMQEFETEPYSRLDKFLIQRGYKFKSAPQSTLLPAYRELNSLDSRIKRRRVDASYPQTFEKYVESVAAYEFELDTRLNVKLLDESTGGDYDVLALNSANDLIYFEAKTGDVGKSDLKNFYERHDFLRPAASILVLDHGKNILKPKLELMRQALTDHLRRADPSSPEAPTFSAIPSELKEYAYHMSRNLYFVSGENVYRGVAHCLRHLDGVVKQTSYFF